MEYRVATYRARAAIPVPLEPVRSNVCPVLDLERTLGDYGAEGNLAVLGPTIVVLDLERPLMDQMRRDRRRDISISVWQKLSPRDFEIRNADEGVHTKERLKLSGSPASRRPSSS